MMSLISGIPGTGGFSGIGTNGILCGFNSYPTSVPSTYSTSSASCFVQLTAGIHIFNFCLRAGSDTAQGSIVVVPSE